MGVRAVAQAIRQAERRRRREVEIARAWKTAVFPSTFFGQIKSRRALVTASIWRRVLLDRLR
jgi:hypothetical protein